MQAYDKYKNKINSIFLTSELFNIQIQSENENYSFYKDDSAPGVIRCIFNSEKMGSFKFNYSYKDNAININSTKGPNIIIYVPGECSEINPQVLYPLENTTQILIPYNYTIKCLDKYNNTVNKGGAKFTTDIKVDSEDSDNTLDFNVEIKDNEDGSYNVVFTPSIFGIYSLVILLNGKKYHEFSLDLTCKEGYICPNNNLKCVSNLLDCIPPEIKCNNSEESKEKPFYCNDTDECVESMTECTPNDGKVQGSCKYMNALYPQSKSYLCSYYLPLDCKRKYPNYKILCNDGICRKNKNSQPSQRVCPIGKILCADLTCQDNIDKCYNDWPECGNTQIRCPDQSCVDDQKYCPTTITCPDPKYKVCPDGTCVENEIYCSALKVCPKDTPYLCTDYSCATKPENCTHTDACGHGKSLCPDLICKESCN